MNMKLKIFLECACGSLLASYLSALSYFDSHENFDDRFLVIFVMFNVIYGSFFMFLNWLAKRNFRKEMALNDESNARIKELYDRLDSLLEGERQVKEMEDRTGLNALRHLMNNKELAERLIKGETL